MTYQKLNSLFDSMRHFHSAYENSYLYSKCVSGLVLLDSLPCLICILFCTVELPHIGRKYGLLFLNVVKVLVGTHISSLKLM